MHKKIFILGTLIFLPIVTSAADITDLKSLVASLVGMINAIIPLIIGIAVLGFIWGVTKYMLHADNEQSRTDGRNLMIYGIIAITVMLSVWGLAKLLKDSFFSSSTLPIGTTGTGSTPTGPYGSSPFPDGGMPPPE